MPIVLCVAGILLLILLVVFVKLDTFISFIVVSIAMALAAGMSTAEVTASLQKGIGNTLGSLVIILGFGAMLGKLVAESGAAQQITASFTRLFGTRHMQWGMALAGLLVGIPLFYTAGFVVVVPLVFATAAATRLPLLYIAIPMLSALSVAHGFLPPHPSPTVIGQQLHASLGLTLIYGLVLAIPTIILAGPLFGKTLKRYNPPLNKDLLQIKILPTDQIPSIGVSLLTALLPLLLLTITTLSLYWFSPGSGIGKIMGFLGEPNIAMLLSLLVAIGLLGLRRGKKITEVMKQLEVALKGIAPVLLIIAGSGVFMQVMHDSGTSNYIAGLLGRLHLSPLLLGWTIAAVIRVCIGSATVAGLTTVSLLLPLLAHSPVHPELMVLSIGAGSLMFSHVNDGGFWLFKEYFNLTVKQTFATWSVMETIVSVSGLLGVLLLNTLLN